jgi:hypothetical protein
VSSDHRLRRLRELLARIEQLPVSPESERMLREVRARVVDVDTGVTPSAMLPVDPVPTLATDPDRGRPDGPPPERTRSVGEAPSEAGSRSGARNPAVGLSAAEDREWLSLVATNEILSLDHSASLPLAGEARVGNDRRPWTRGLRG